MIRKEEKKLNKMLFIYLKEDFGVYKFGDEVNSTYIREYLKRNGVNVEQYIEDNLVNIVDSVDDIMVEGYENIMFFIDNKNRRISRLISREIKENYDEAKVIWFGEVSNYEQCIKDEYIDIAVLEDPEEALLEIAKEIEPSKIPGIAYMEDDEVVVTETSVNQQREISQSSTESEGCSNENGQEKASLYKAAMINGVNASITGIYPENAVGNCSKHITVDKETITAKDYEYLKDFLSLNSAVIHRNEKAEGYEKNIADSEKAGCYLPHYHKVDKDQQIHIDNSNIIKKLNFVNYSKAQEDLSDSYLRIESAEDVESLIKDVNYFKETGTIKNYVVNNKIENECRWTSNGACRLKSLIRFNIKEEGEIVPCSGCSCSIGNIKDGYNASVRKVYKHMDKAYITRECSGCKVNDRCSKCSMVLDDMKDINYCSVRRNNPELAEFFIKRNILSYLISSTNTFKNMDTKNIKFSTQHASHVFPGGRSAESESLLQPYICLTLIGESPILIDLTNGNLNKISRELAFVIEGLIKGFGVEAIKDEIESIVDTNAFDKELIVNSCIDFLSKNNYIKVVV